MSDLADFIEAASQGLARGPLWAQAAYAMQGGLPAGIPPVAGRTVSLSGVNACVFIVS